LQHDNIILFVIFGFHYFKFPLNCPKSEIFWNTTAKIFHICFWCYSQKYMMLLHDFKKYWIVWINR
jgi:hypothetical protein